MKTLEKKTKTATAVTTTTKARTTSKSASKSILTVQNVERTEIIKGVVITLKVPADIAALLVKPGYYTRLLSAEVWVGGEDGRFNEWDKTTRLDSKKLAPRKTLLAEILQQKLDAELRVYFEPAEWQRIEELCKRLKITPSDWMLSSAAYNAKVERDRLAKA